MGRGLSSRRQILKGGAAASLVGLAGCAGAFGASEKTTETTLKLGHPVPESSVPLGTFNAGFAEKVKEKTDGSVIIDVFPGGQLGTSVEQLEGVSSGTQAMTNNPHDILNNKYGAVAFPYLYENYEEMLKKTDPYKSKPIQKLNEDSITNYNFRAITYVPSGNRTVQMTGKEETCVPQDLKGKTIRSPGSKYFSTMTEGLGASPTAMDFGDVSSALATGSIDGLEVYVGLTQALGFFENIDQVVQTNHTQYPIVLGINEGKWQNLSSEEQDALIEAAREQRQETASRLVKHEADALKTAEEQNIKVQRIEGCVEYQTFKENCQSRMYEVFPDWKERVTAIDQAR